MVTLAIALLVPALGATPAEASRHHKKHIVHHVADRFAEIVIESSTGYVLSEKNPDKRLYPASLSKMMTLYLTFDALEDGTLSKNAHVPVSRRASSQEPSSLGLSAGDSVRVEDCILGIATKSANDCAVVLAEAVGGSEEHFATLMTAKAHQLGMKNTHFVNASGLFKPQQYSSARDMSTLARALIRNHSRYYHYFSTESFTYNGATFPNHNKLMAIYRGMDGLKTGYVYASGYNLAASAVRNGTRLIGVIFGGQTAKSRNNAMAQLLNQGFARISNTRLSSLANNSTANNTPRQQPKPLLPAHRPFVVPDTTPEVSADSSPAPQFNAMGLAVDQGDTDINGEDGAKGNKTVENNPAPEPQQPAAPAPVAHQASIANGSWAVQIGSFANRNDGEQALQVAKATLQGVVNGNDSIAPLMTARGLVYRARLSDLDRGGAVQACRILKGNCIILSEE